jgi:hypothetical protein
MSREKQTRQSQASRLMAAVTRAVIRARAWSAPRVERSGQVVQDSVAPKVASMLTSAAHRIDPSEPRSARWRRPAGIATAGAAASTMAAIVRRRRKPAAGSSSAEHNGVAETHDGVAEADDTRTTVPPGA